MSQSSPQRRQLSPEAYTVGWTSALSIEYTVAIKMLDEEHEAPELLDSNNEGVLYTFGRICHHNVVIASPASGSTESAANIAKYLKKRFPNTTFGLMVGLGGAMLNGEEDIRLGDVVVSHDDTGQSGGVVQHSMGNNRYHKAPPKALLNALREVKARSVSGKSELPEHLSRVVESLPAFRRVMAGPDQLFSLINQHHGGPSCENCNEVFLIERAARSDDTVVHYGTIATVASPILDAIERESLRKSLGKRLLCVETEAVGLQSIESYLFIRGICDYADSHRNEKWQPYAAAAASAYAKELISILPSKELAEDQTQRGKSFSTVPILPDRHFIERSDITTWLHENCDQPDSRVAIYGLAGIG